MQLSVCTTEPSSAAAYELISQPDTCQHGHHNHLADHKSAAISSVLPVFGRSHLERDAVFICCQGGLVRLRANVRPHSHCAPIDKNQNIMCVCVWQPACHRHFRHDTSDGARACVCVRRQISAFVVI